MSLSIDPLSGTHIDTAKVKAQCLDVRQYFNSHYAAKPEEQEIILSYAMQLKPNDVAVELGVCNGHTASMLAQCASYTKSFYYGVDAFMLECRGVDEEPDVSRTGIAQWHYLIERFDDLNLNGQIFFGKTQEVGATWAKYVGRTSYDGYEGIALLFIDAGHDEANVKADIDIWLPLVKPGGVVIFHDYDDPYDIISPHWAVRHYADSATCGFNPEWDRRIVGSMLIATKHIPIKPVFAETEPTANNEDNSNKE